MKECDIFGVGGWIKTFFDPSYIFSWDQDPNPVGSMPLAMVISTTDSHTANSRPKIQQKRLKLLFRRQRV